MVLQYLPLIIEEMKIFVLTSNLAEKHGYGRYSINLASALREKGVETVFAQGLPNPLSYKKNYFLAFWYALRLQGRAKDCDIIHSFVEPYSYIAYWLSKFTGKKYFITVHGTFGVLPYSFPSYKRYFHKKSFENAAMVICVSRYTKKRLSEFGLKNLEVINNGINFEKFYREPLPPPDERGSIILSVGALKHRKGYHVSLEAFTKVCSKFANLKYTIVGDQGDSIYFAQLKKTVSRLGVEDKVEFLKNISDDKLLNLYRKAKLFVLTPVSEGSNFEGFGLVYLEAGASGLPVIGSLDSGAEDAIKDGETGILVPQNDPEVTAKAIIKILENSSLAKNLETNGVMWAKEHDWRKITQSYLEIYK